MEYDQVIEALAQVNMSQGVQFRGLDNIKKLANLLGHPENQYKIIHIAGTNGKGSVCKKVAKGLTLAGYKVGTYTSPHFRTFRERIRLNDELIPKEAVVEILPNILKLVQTINSEKTLFEITTILAFEYFKREKVDYAVIEAGIGGKWDATNIVSPILSIITSIGLDHTDILGNTIEEITIQKAGIIKKGIPVVIGSTVPVDIVKNYVSENKLNADVHPITGTFATYDEENNTTATKALELLHVKSTLISQALQVRPEGRFQLLKKDHKNIILDVAHNPQGLQELFKVWKKEFPEKKCHILFGLSQNKDIAACLNIMKDHAQKFYPVVTTNGRGFPTQGLKEKLIELGIADHQIELNATISDSFNSAVKQLKDSEVLLVCGTFFIMSDILEILDIGEEKDAIDLNEKFKKKNEPVH